MSYDEDGFVTGSDPEFKTESIFEPMASTGVSFNYDIDIFRISAAASYGMIFEKDSSLRFYSFYAGGGVRF